VDQRVVDGIEQFREPDHIDVGGLECISASLAGGHGGSAPELIPQRRDVFRGQCAGGDGGLAQMVTGLHVSHAVAEMAGERVGPGSVIALDGDHRSTTLNGRDRLGLG
jgi:hypothetical protein